MTSEEEQVNTKCLELVKAAFAEKAEQEIILPNIDSATHFNDANIIIGKSWIPQHGMTVRYEGNPFNANDKVTVSRSLQGTGEHTFEAGMRVSSHPEWATRGDHLGRSYYVYFPEYKLEIVVGLQSDHVDIVDQGSYVFPLQNAKCVVPALFDGDALKPHDELCYLLHDFVFCAGANSITD